MKSTSCMDLVLNACTQVVEISIMFFVDTNPYLEILQLSLRDAQKFVFDTENEDGRMVFRL